MKLRIKFLVIISILAHIFGIKFAMANVDLNQIKTTCHADLKFIRNTLIEQGAPYKAKEDRHFHEWLKLGYEHASELIDELGDEDDCYYAINYYVNGFQDRSIFLRTNINMPDKLYPGFISALVNGKHVVVYKHPAVEYLDIMQVGDEVTKIDGQSTNKFWALYIKPFYANSESDYANISSSTNIFIEDGNRFIPSPKKANFKNSDGDEYTLDLQYTTVVNQAERLVAKYQKPGLVNFKVDILSDGVWARIPSFFPTQEEIISFRGLLSTLSKFSNMEYIVFDLRGNLGGDPELQRAILRNLYGDKYLKSLGSKHSFNNSWTNKHILTKSNLAEFRKDRLKGEVGNFSRMLKKGRSFYNEKIDPYKSNKFLFTNNEVGNVRAKVIAFTDHFCSGACWMFVQQLVQIPGAMHYGQTTDIENQYANSRKFQAPSEKFEIFVPSQVIENIKMNFGSELIPQKAFDGDASNDVEVIDWVLSEIQ